MGQIWSTRSKVTVVSLSDHQAVKLYGDVTVTPHIFLTLALDGMNTQLHASGTLTTGNETWVYIGFMAV
jgi:hypothetical protein